MATLFERNTPDAGSAAVEIGNTLDLNADRVGLTGMQRDAVLAVLEDAATPALAQLRGRLADDAAHRHRLE